MSIPTTRLVLHADDLGINRAVTDGILRAFRQGLLTSTSLLSNAPDAAHALGAWKELSTEHAAGSLPSAPLRHRLGDPIQPFDLGVHLNLTQGRPLSGSRYPAELLDTEGRFPGIFRLFARLRLGGQRYRPAIRDELTRQVQIVSDHGLRPTHLNGHQYVEMIPAVSQLVPELVERFGIHSARLAREHGLLRTTLLYGRYTLRWPLARVKSQFARRFGRLLDANRIAHPDAFYGTAHAGDVDLKLLAMFLASGRSWPLVEIGLHPGEADNAASAASQAEGWHDPLAASRPSELDMLVSAELPQIIEHAGRQPGRLAMP